MTKRVMAYVLLFCTASRLNMTGFRSLVSISALLCLSNWTPSATASVSTQEFLAHCDATPEPCKRTMFAYLKFLVDGGFVDSCVMHMPAEGVATKVLGEMRNHAERGEESGSTGLKTLSKDTNFMANKCHARLIAESRNCLDPERLPRFRARIQRDFDARR
jgi:hypothetical protein